MKIRLAKKIVRQFGLNGLKKDSISDYWQKHWSRYYLRKFGDPFVDHRIIKAISLMSKKKRNGNTK